MSVAPAEEATLAVMDVDRALSGSVINTAQLQDAGIASLADITRLDAGITDAYFSNVIAADEPAAARCVLRGSLRGGTVDDPFHVAEVLQFPQGLAHGLLGNPGALGKFRHPCSAQPHIGKNHLVRKAEILVAPLPQLAGNPTVEVAGEFPHDPAQIGGQAARCALVLVAIVLRIHKMTPMQRNYSARYKPRALPAVPFWYKAGKNPPPAPDLDPTSPFRYTAPLS